jgi:hypothetical protein
MRTTAYIITCPKLAPIRLPSLLEKIGRLKDTGAISDINIIDQDDNVYSGYSSKNYLPKLWGEYLAIGAPYFSYNIVSGCQHEQNFPVIYEYAIESLTSVLPARELTTIEHSIANRHHFALKQIGESYGVGIVFEDDVILKDKPLE